MQLGGFHHLTAVTARARDNLAFYTRTLGMRLVKRTVNQDDVSAYHLFYGDGAGSPGSDLTFFDFAAPPERRGTSAIVSTGLRVDDASFGYWARRFRELNVTHGPQTTRSGRAVLDFEDAEGQRLSLVADESGAAGKAWAASDVPAAHQIRGLGCIRLSVPELSRTEQILIEVMQMRRTPDYALGDATLHVFQMGDGGPAAELHVAVESGIARTRHGAGGVHHIAFRLPDADYTEWQERLEQFGVANSGPVDRFYFRRLYFREPNGILFELATDGPGFTADEPLATLGEKLSLPPFLESERARIEAGLKPL
ncbi:MAG: ring-cleaving dioxygenase [Verrucomicrobiota bacterium]|nr:ring-cleaving dioxygenase [Verrucomicrobiota bacterium]